MDVIDPLSGLFIPRGVPGRVRSDNGPELVAEAVRQWVAAVGAKTAFVEPGGPWEDRHVESLTPKPRDEPPDGEVLHPLAEARVVVEARRRRYDAVRPRSARGHKPPAPEVEPWSATPAKAVPPAALAVAPGQSCSKTRPGSPVWERARLAFPLKRGLS